MELKSAIAVRPYQETDIKDANLTMLIASYRHADTILPELHSFLGHDKFLEFLDIFAGVEVKVPSSNELMKAIQDCVIYRKMGKIKGRSDEAKSMGDAMKRALAKRYSTSSEKIQQRYDEVKSIISRSIEAL